MKHTCRNQEVADREDEAQEIRRKERKGAAGDSLLWLMVCVCVRYALCHSLYASGMGTFLLHC
jgi:hypothetical protein